MPPRTIVVPVDFSDHSGAAADLALAQLQHTGGHLDLLHCDPVPASSAAAPEPFYVAPQLWSFLVRSHADRVAERLRDLREALLSRAPEGVTVDTHHIQADPASGIIDHAAENRADYIALGTHGASAATLYRFGSITQRIARDAPCPVLITNADIKEREEERIGEPRPFERVLVGIDYSPLSVRAARAGRDALAPGGTLELVHVWHAPHMPTMELSIDTRRDDLLELIETYRRAEVERLSKFILELGLDIEDDRLHAYIEVGTATRGLLQRADDTGADAIVLGAHGRDTLEEKLVGTVADRVLRNTAIPALLIPETAAR